MNARSVMNPFKKDMEGNQHAKGIQHVKDIMRLGGAIILENSNERGQGGFKFPAAMTGRSNLPVEYTADIFMILPSGQPIMIESDGIKAGQGHFTSFAQFRDNFRDAFFASNYGMLTLRYPTPYMVELTEADILADLQKKNFDFRKKLCATYPQVTTA